MSDTHRIIITDDALSELEGIARYIRQHSPQNAANVAAKILDSIDSLALMPNRFRQVGKSKKRGTEIRAMLVRPYIVYYRIEDDSLVVFVLTIRHASQRQPRRLPQDN